MFGSRILYAFLSSVQGTRLPPATSRPFNAFKNINICTYTKKLGAPNPEVIEVPIFLQPVWRKENDNHAYAKAKK